MNTTRRGFMKLLGAGAAGAAVAPLVRAAPEPEPVAEPHPFGIDPTKPMEWRSFRSTHSFDQDALEFVEPWSNPTRCGIIRPDDEFIRRVMMEKEQSLYAMLGEQLKDQSWRIRPRTVIADRIML